MKSWVAAAMATMGLAFSATPSSAVVLFWSIDDGAEIYDEIDTSNPALDPGNILPGMISGGFRYDTETRILSNVDIEVSALTADFAVFNGRYTKINFATSDTLTLAKDNALGIPGDPVIGIRGRLSDFTGILDISEPESGFPLILDRSTIDLYSFLGVCGAGCDVLLDSVDLDEFSGANGLSTSAVIDATASAAVPLPPGLALLLSGLGLVGALRARGAVTRR